MAMLSLATVTHHLLLLALPRLRHHQPNTTQMILVQLILGIDPAGNRAGPIVEQVVMELPVAGAKLLLLQEQRVVHERQRVEHIQFGPLGEDQGIVDERVETSLESRLVKRLAEAGLAGVVEEVGDAEDVVVLDDGGFDAEEGEEVGDFAIVLGCAWLDLSCCRCLARPWGGTVTYLDHI